MALPAEACVPLCLGSSESQDPEALQSLLPFHRFPFNRFKLGISLLCDGCARGTNTEILQETDNSKVSAVIQYGW